MRGDTMSKFSNLMKMLILLKAHRQLKIEELATYLEVNKRMIQTYKDDLMMAGIYLESRAGRYGGYSLPKGHDCYLQLALDPDEVTALEMAYKQLEESGFVYQEELFNAYHKVMATMQCVKPTAEGLDHDYHFGSKSSPAALLGNQESEYCKLIHASIIQKTKVQFNYYSLYNDTYQDRTVSPYAIYEYKNAVYMTGFCNLRQELRDFKLSRIKSLEMTKDRFVMPKDFSLKKQMQNCLGIFKDQPQKVVLKIRHPMSQITREKNWADNQIITDLIEEKAILFEAKLRGEVEIISWILSMGADVEVLEPIELKNKIKKILSDMIENY